MKFVKRNGSALGSFAYGQNQHFVILVTKEDLTKERIYAMIPSYILAYITHHSWCNGYCPGTPKHRAHQRVGEVCTCGLTELLKEVGDKKV